MNVTFWTGIGLLFFNIGTHFSLSSPTRPLDKKKSIKDQIVYVNELQHEPVKYLVCLAENKSDIVWKKNGKTLDNTPQFQPYISFTKLPLICLTKKDEGNYTCHYRSKMQLTSTKITLKVIAGTNNHPCGKPKKDLITDIPLCSITTDDYPCCQRFASPPEIVDISETLKKSFNCSLYNSLEQEPWKLKVTWKLRNNSDDSIWGWRIDTFCTNTQYRTCIQINSKDKIMNWTFSGYSFGSECDVTIRPLPQNYSKPNFVRGKFTINSTKDMCNSIGHECEWEICWPVEHLKVTEQNNRTVLVSWSPSRYYRTLQSYKVDYWCKEDKKGGQKYVKDSTEVILEELNMHKCTQYFVTVTPMFAKRELGTRSKKSFTFSLPDKPTDYIKIIILCSIIPLSMACLLVYIVTRSRKRKYSSTAGHVSTQETGSEATKVFIVHDKHCDLCDEVTHSLVDVLNKTGYIKCILDLRCTKEITKCGMVWYEKQLKNCEKVLVICSKEGRKILDEKENKKCYPESKIYIFILNMMLGRAVHHNNEEAVLVCFDYSSHEDIPYFLSNRPHYFLPSEIEKLCFSLHSASFENRSDCQNRNTNEMPRNASIAKLKSAIEKVRRDHYNKAMVTKIGRALLRCNEESSVLV